MECYAPKKSSVGYPDCFITATEEALMPHHFTNDAPKILWFSTAVARAASWCYERCSDEPS